MQVDGIPGGLPPLVYVLGWATDPTGPRWLLEHGADANLAWGDEGEAPLHVAARRWDESMVAMLAAHGADLQRRRTDGQNAHTVAALSGNLAVAEWLRAHGCPDELTPLQRFVAAAARGDRAAADAMLARQPSLRDELRLEHHLLLHRAAESGNLPMLETMVACGFDVNVADKDGVTPLHRAAMAGQRDAVRTLIAHGAAVDALDGTFAAPPLVWAAEGRSNSKRDGVTRDFVGVARALIDSGASQTWTPPEGAPHSEGAIDGLAQLCAEATAR